MNLTPFERWQEWALSFNMLPMVFSFPLEQDRMGAWEEVWKSNNSPYSFVLESGKSGTYTFFSMSPISVILGKGNDAIIRHYNESEQISVHEVKGNPLACIKDWMDPWRTPIVANAPKFIGGCVGYLSYDVARSIEKLPNIAKDDLVLPDYYMMMFNQLWIVDHREKKLFCAVHQKITDREKLDALHLQNLYHQTVDQVNGMKRLWDCLDSEQSRCKSEWRRNVCQQLIEQDHELIDNQHLSDIETAFPKEAFIHAVQRIQQYIAQGDVFQVNLSVRQNRKLNLTPEEMYEWLRILNPSPYMGLIRFPELSLVSCSPELLVKLEGQTMETRPIAGTRPRGRNEDEDRKLADELITNEKERAEHIMLVDLLRNDLGRVSRYGSVDVNELMVIEHYSHVMHIVSNVRGEIASGCNAFDAISAIFPGGTITGAPKIRTMEIIDELEPVRRGPYTGSIGWIDYNGNMELNITIRTLVAYEGIGYIQAGAGIVIDSVPEKEYVESLDKAKALWKAIQYAEHAAKMNKHFSMHPTNS